VLKYDASHKFAKLIGSPPGYPEYRNTHPLSKQEVMKQFPTANVNFSVALFNEIALLSKTDLTQRTAC
jgi:ATP-dependent Clp protease ATP-binding subunit ClpA